MYKVICIYCGTENTFSKKEQKPEECSNQACQHYLGGLDIITIYNENKKTQQNENEKLIGLKLIYQKTSEEILIKTNSKIVLGRNNYGREIFKNIDQISRSHCSVEFRDNKYIITDLESTNGTFIGIGDEKIRCTSPQVINRNDFLVLGKEVFLVKFLIEGNQSKVVEVSQIETIKNEKLEEKLCSECSCVLKEIPCSCPDCGTWNE